jgi:hypothetical protein
MRNVCRSSLTCLVWVCALTVASDASAQVNATAEIRRELSALRGEVDRLRAELATLRSMMAPPPSSTARAVTASASISSQTPTIQSAVEILQTQVAELAQVKVESASRMPVKMFGTIHSHAFWNSAQPNWLDSPNLVNLPQADGHAGSFSSSLRQTRIGMTASGPSIGSFRTNGTLAFDFFGGIPGFVTGQVMGLPRLLVAYARVEGERTSAEIGQDHVMLAPVDPTSLASFAFPALFRSGNLYLRAPQARVEQRLGRNLRVMGGIVAPIAGDVPGEDYRFVPQAFTGERSKRPGVQGRVLFSTGDRDTNRFVEAGVSGHYGWEQRPTTLARSYASAADFAFRWNHVGAAGEFFTGENLDAFGGGTGLDSPANGGWAELQLHAGNRLTVTGGAGRDRLRGTLPASLPRHRNQSAFGTAIFSLRPEVQTSFEYHWLATSPALGGQRVNRHFDWVLAYSF